MNDAELMEHGRRAVHEAQTALSLGASNWPDNPKPENVGCIKRLRSIYGQLVEGRLNTAQEILNIAGAAANARCGNCQEHAALAFQYLWLEGIRPIHFLHEPKGDHNVVAIGPNEAGSVVIDAWRGQVARWSEYPRASVTEFRLSFY